MPGPRGGARQLIHAASLYLLEQELRRLGLDEEMLWRDTGDWSAVGAPLERWIETAAGALAHAAAGVASVLDPR